MNQTLNVSFPREPSFPQPGGPREPLPPLRPPGLG